MRKYDVSYQGNSTRFRNFHFETFAHSEREAVEGIYKTMLDKDYFPDDQGNIFDVDQNLVADKNSTTISYENGYFFATPIN